MANAPYSSASIFSKVVCPYTCGIYRIRNVRNGKFYIGQAKNFESRRKTHLYELKVGKKNKKFQNAWNAEIDKNVFFFEIILVCSKEMLVFYEQLMFDNFKPFYNGNYLAGRPDPKTWWENLTPEERGVQIEKARLGLVNISPAKKVKKVERLIESGKAYWGRIDAEERNQRGEVVSVAYSRMPEGKKKQMAENSSMALTQYWAEKDQHFRTQWGRQIAKRYENMNEEERGIHNKNKSEAQTLRWAATTEEERIAHGDAVKLGQSKMTTDDWARRNAKLSLTFSGENGPNAVLTKKQAEEIRSALATTEELSKLYKVSSRTIRDIKNGVTWKTCITPIVPLIRTKRSVGKDGRFLSKSLRKNTES